MIKKLIPMASIGMFAILIFTTTVFSGEEEQKNMQPVTVKFVSLERYVGLWYEIAKLPNRFQRKCASGTTAQYALRNDDQIEVVNRCFDKDGKLIEAKGIARIVDTKSNAKLKVSFVSIFGKHLFWGDYWIIGLDENYGYAIVGVSNRKYGWILSRRPKLTSEELEKIFVVLREQGYDPDQFVMTMHAEE